VKDFSIGFLYNTLNLYSNQDVKGLRYNSLRQVICIVITNFEMFPNKKDYISFHKIMDVKTKENVFSDLSFVFIELPKFSNQSENKDLEEWCDFLKNATNYESFDTNNPIIHKAHVLLEKNNFTNVELIQNFAEEKVILEGLYFDDPIYEKGLEIGQKEAEKREKKLKIDIAKRLLNESELDEENISKITRLSKEEVSKLRRKNQII